MIKNVINSWFTVFTITMTNIIQFIITLSILFHDIICLKTIGFLFIAGFITVPTMFVINGIWSYKGTMLVFKLSSTFVLLIIYPGAVSYMTVMSILTCPDNNMLVWFFQGMSVPILIWTLYKLIRYDNDKCTNTLPPIWRPMTIF